MTTLVVGASGATGRLVVRELLCRGETVRAVVRCKNTLPPWLLESPSLQIVEANLLELPTEDLSELVGDSDNIVSCLGHNLSLGGIFGHPRRLVTEAVTKLTDAFAATGQHRAVKFVLMNSTGCRNLDLNEPTPLSQRMVVSIVRNLIPPHADNEEAGNYLRSRIGQNNPLVNWAIVRPDTLTDDDFVSEYTIHPSPTRNAIFDAGHTSRINVAHFMVELILNTETWSKWQGKMPVIYNA